MRDMKKIFIMLVAAGCFLAFCGCDDNGSSQSSSVSRQEAEEMRRRNDCLEARVAQLESEKEKVEKERDEARDIAKSRHTELSIIFCVALGIVVLIIGGFVFMVRATKRAPAKMSNDSLHCPRCGWEHRPEETICKNCKTHF